MLLEIISQQKLHEDFTLKLLLPARPENVGDHTRIRKCLRAMSEIKPHIFSSPKDYFDSRLGSAYLQVCRSFFNLSKHMPGMCAAAR